MSETSESSNSSSSSVVSTSIDDLHVGAEFTTVAEATQALRQYAIANYFSFKIERRDKRRYWAVCKVEACTFCCNFNYSVKKGSFVLTKLEADHTCTPVSHVARPAAANVQWICQRIVPTITDNKHTVPKDIVNDIRRNEGSHIPYMAAWRGKQTALAHINADEASSYKKIPAYVNKVREEGGHAVCHFANDNRFVRVFVALDATRKCYRNTLQFIGLDGTHLKAKYLGILLIAVTLDANFEVVPLAYAVVISENEDNWCWFLHNLRIAYPEIDADGKNTTIISDRDKGLIEGVHSELDGAIHCLCVHHLAANFQTRFKDTRLTKILWKAAYSTTKEVYREQMEVMRSLSVVAAAYLEDADPQLWATAVSKGVKYGHVTSNISESINSSLLKTRELPVIQVLLGIHEYTMRKFFDRRTKAQALTGLLVPKAAKKLAGNIKYGRHYVAYPSDNDIGLVSKLDGRRVTVKVSRKECSCGRFQIDRIPCNHACAFLLHLRKNPEDAVDPLFLLENYRQTYCHRVLPIRMEDLEDDIEKLPPTTTRPRGRPKKVRQRHASERDRKQNTCGRCGRKGYSKRTCKEPIQ